MFRIYLKKYQWSLIYGLLTTVFILFIFLPKLLSSFRYDSDFARDITEIQEITQGHIRLIGPKLSFGGIFTGPYYYYLFTPAMLAFSGKPEAVVYFNLILFAFGAGLTTFVLSTYQTNKRSPAVFLASSWLFSTTYFIFALKNPVNAFSYLPLLTVLLVTFPLLAKQKRWFWWFLWGFFYGVVVNFHLISVITFFSLVLVWLLASLVKKKGFIKQFLSLSVGFFLSFLPLAIFELRHNFIMFRNTFIEKSYKVFTNNANLPNPLTTSKNPVINFGLQVKHFNSWTQLGFGLMFFILLCLLIWLLWQKKLKSTDPTVQLTFVSLLSFLLFVVVARSQLAFHYFYPFLLMTQVSLIFLALKLKNKLKLVIFALFLFINIFFWPKELFQPSTRTINQFRTTSQSIFSSQKLKPYLNKPFNLFVVRETPLAVLGWEYRYFLEHFGLKPLGIQQYNQAQYLLVVDETGKSDVKKVRSWEIEQFGEKKQVLSLPINHRQVYLFEKVKK